MVYEGVQGSRRGAVVYEGGQHPAEALCLCSRDMRLKVREHVPHWYFLTWEWVCRWARRLERSAKARLQWGQAKGRSPGGRDTGFRLILTGSAVWFS